jgi:hypothetical protein
MPNKKEGRNKSQSRRNQNSRLPNGHTSREDGGRNSLPEGMTKRNDSLPGNDGGTSGVQRAKLRGHGIPSAASGGPLGICSRGTCRRTEEAA